MRQLVFKPPGTYVLTVFTEVNILLSTLPGPRVGLHQIRGLSTDRVYVCLLPHDSCTTEGKRCRLRETLCPLTKPLPPVVFL